MQIRPFDESLDKARVLAVMNKVLKELNPGLSFKEEQFDGMLAVEGDQTILSRDSLVMLDDGGKIIGFTGLLKSSKRNFWRLEIAVLSEYYQSNSTLELFESILNLAAKQNAPEIRFTARKIVFIDSPIHKKLKEMGLNPVHYNWWMRIDKIDSIPPSTVPHGITFHKQKDLSDLTSYVKVVNDAFSKHFDFRPYEEEEFKKVQGESWKKYDVEHWLAHEGNKLVGILTIIINPTLQQVGEIDILGVLHSCHHRGIGRSLLSLGIQSLIKKGCKTIELVVEANNDKALALYKKFGFSEVETRTRIFYTIK
jgi:mycothiol synthase